MIIAGYKKSNLNNYNRENLCKKDSTFTSAPVYSVKNSTLLKKALPTIAFVSSIMGSVFYLVGGTGLYYDLFKEKQAKKTMPKSVAPSQELPKQYAVFKQKKKDKEEGVKTIEADTKFGKIGITCAKLAITATTVAGVACGLGEGIPLMAIGEATNLGSAKIIETPIGTGLFGIGIASIFAGLAFDNTPELKLNNLDLMAEKTFKNKSKLILKNIKDTGKEIGSSIFQMAKNIFNPKFYKENILQITPKNIVFTESVNKEGKIIFSRALRHNKNYLMHAASFVLGIGGSLLVISSLFKEKKSQKAGLVVEEGGFLFDNFAMTRYGLDKLTTSAKPAGASFAVGGIINAISQFIGLDNKDGRALQWLGISGVFLGFAIDRGKHFKDAMKLSKQRPELTRVVREWKFDLSELIKDKKELKTLIQQLQDNKDVTNPKFLELEKIMRETFGESYKSEEIITSGLKTKLGEDIAKKIEYKKHKDYDSAVEIVKYCTKKIFGSDNPTPVSPKN